MKPPEDTSPKHVFVCYSRTDVETVDRLVRGLETLDHKIWIDRTGIAGSQTWRAKIVEALKHSRAVLFFGSRASYDSRHVATELTLAEESLIPIVPVLLDESKADGDMLYFLARLHHLRLNAGQDRETLTAIHQALVGIDGHVTARPISASRSRGRRVSLPTPFVTLICLACLAFGAWFVWHRNARVGTPDPSQPASAFPTAASGNDHGAGPVPEPPKTGIGNATEPPSSSTSIPAAAPGETESGPAFLKPTGPLPSKPEYNVPGSVKPSFPNK